jgi:glycosyltransferase involved in cell wall biosynthesis
MILLSILIPTIPERNEKFTALYNEIMRQKTAFDTFHSSVGELEIVVNAGVKFLDGGLSIGKKREALVKEANGEYLCFLDDDESISPNYVETLMRLCKQGADVCTFRAIVKMETFWSVLDMRLVYNFNDQLNPDYTVRRPPWHVCPMRSKYAKMFHFQDINAAEDFEWMKKVLLRCTTEAHTDKVIFQYNHKSESESDKILNKGYA